MPGYSGTKEAHLKRLKRVQGQLKGLERMINEDKYCIDVLIQISAATGALQSLALALLDDHLSHCVVNAAKEGGEEAQIKLAEVNDAIARLVRR
ncbi:MULTISPECIES: metal-sensitive transcriptional regulator [Propionimicrobium]|uniref:metal-sensitive transcriptional regulator n=1 Tax=Propionimicrobium TaxID=203133 RepID=UPI00048A6221